MCAGVMGWMLGWGEGGGLTPNLVFSFRGAVGKKMSQKVEKIHNFLYPPVRLKNLKLPKNHFKTNLFFVQQKHLKSTFTFGTF